MKRKLLSLLLTLGLLSGCAGSPQPGSQEDTLTILATTYPVYLMTCAVVEGVDGVQVDRLNTGETSCLHDYTLSVNDMKKIERADVIAMNGVGLEEFMEDALDTSGALVIDCSEGVHLLENLSHHHEEGDHSHDGHDHGHFDPHYWMDPKNAQVMVENLVSGLSGLDNGHEDTYFTNGLNAAALLNSWDGHARDCLDNALNYVDNFSVSGLITFHDGFQYFAHAYDLPLLESIEEEAGSEASAHEILEITQLVKERNIPVIFTEVNGSDATAKAIARETGCQIAQLSTCMDGPDDQLSNYLDVMMNNMAAVVNGFAGEEIIVK
jgi:ABC-type Zn uptake system ZnuABC Zn-binding protein ZnuA